MSESKAQELLDNAIRLRDLTGQALWAVEGDWCFVARPTSTDEQIWHGYPVIGGEVPENVLAELEGIGRIGRRQRRRLRKQKSLPSRLP